jgi:hypothetical protein
MLVHGEMDGASLELEQQFLRIAIPFVLLDRVGDGLLRQIVFEFERGNRQAIDEQTQIERKSLPLAPCDPLACRELVGSHRGRAFLPRSGLVPLALHTVPGLIRTRREGEREG